MFISTIMALQEAVTNTMKNDDVRSWAGYLVENRDSLTDEQFIEQLFEYSANLTALSSELVTKVFMTQEQIDEMVATSVELMKFEPDED